MDQRMLLLMFISGLFSSSSPVFLLYHYVSEGKTWLEAQSYCRMTYTDLATVDNMEEMDRLIKRADPGYTGDVWIGLQRGTQTHWHWSVGNYTQFQYTNWNPEKPDGNGECALMAYGKWTNMQCTEQAHYICMGDQNNYIYVMQTKSWREAQTDCRNRYTDLASIQSAEENSQVYALITYDSFVWIGLFLDSWQWSDQRNASFRLWATGQPTETESCGAVKMTDLGKWYSVSCDIKLPFFCYGDAKRQILRLKVSSIPNVDVNDPKVKAFILLKIEEKLRAHGMDNGTTLSWRETPDGKVFHREKTEERKMTKKSCNDEL